MSNEESRLTLPSLWNSDAKGFESAVGDILIAKEPSLLVASLLALELRV